MNVNKVNTTLSQYNIDDRLIENSQRMQSTKMASLFTKDPNRFHNFSCETDNLFLDYSKNLVDQQTLDDLFKLAEESSISTAISNMFNGKKINSTENRAVMHIALRNFGGVPILVDRKNIMEDVNETFERIEALVKSVHTGNWQGWTNKQIKHIVNIGIGGSYLGVQTVIDALKPYHNELIKPHYISNIDPSEVATVLERINPETTLFIVASKTFTTLETLKNATTVRKWMLNQGLPKTDIEKHFIAITTNQKAAIEFGISEDNIFPLWDWVGGRYSLWSAIGMMIPFIIGFDHFIELLRGAYSVDKHFATAPINKNMPIILGLLGIWYHNYFNAESYAILPYDNNLKTFVDHLQQVDMESNGKSVTKSGDSLPYHTGPIIWGNVGTNGQHAYHQLLHQGTRFIPIDFIVPLTTKYYAYNHQHKWLVANAFAQSQALMEGISKEEQKKRMLENGMGEKQAERLSSHKAVPGNRPSNTITMKQLMPKTMGALLALYEHKIFVQGHIWGINSFDQWGVELGKVLSQNMHQYMSHESTNRQVDSSTNGLINQFVELNELDDNDI